MKFQGISIIKHKTCNTWYARYRNNGKQFYVSARTQLDCYNKLKIALKNKDKQVQTKSKCITFIEWYNKWLEVYKIGKVKETTLIDYKSSMKYLTNIYNIELNQLTNLIITEQLNKINFERRKQKVYELLNNIFNKAIKNHIITNNPIIDKKPKHTRVNGISLTIKDQQNFINICKKEYEMFLVCLFQGLRKGEMLALTKQDFDFTNKTLTINKSLNIFNQIDKTKNEYSTRVIPLFDNTINLIKNKLSLLKDNERVFNYSNQWCQKLFKKLQEDNKLNPKYTIHSLRHTFITSCQEKNIPLHIIQKWVGHRLGSKVTNEVYTHSRTEIEKQFANIINQGF